MSLGIRILQARHKIARAGRVLLGSEWAGRNLTILPDDTFIVTFPRSGNTWLRFLIGNLIHPETPVTFANLESFIPYVDIHSDRFLLGAPRPRILESHETFFPAYPKVIYLVRDPRDVAISYHYILIKDRHLPENFPFENFLDGFLAGKDYGHRLGPWADHVMSWVNMRQGSPNFLLLRYEDLLENTQRELARVAKFIGVSASREQLDHAVEMSSAARMRNLEKSQGRLWKSTRRSRQDKPFVRVAASGGWRSALPEESVTAIERSCGEAMRVLGYSPVSSPSLANVSRA